MDTVQAVLDPKQIETVAHEFSKVLSEWLTPAQCRAVLACNATEPFQTSGACASHDFSDANMAMEEAFHNLDLQTCADLSADLWNVAWTWRGPTASTGCNHEQASGYPDNPARSEEAP